MTRVSRSLIVTAAIAAALAPAGLLFAKKKAAPPPPPPPPQNTAAAAILADQTDITADQADFVKANKALSDAAEKLMVDFDKAPDAIAAKKAVTDAMAAEEKTRAAAVATLASDPAYTAATAKEKAAQTELDALRGADDLDKDAISAKATEVFEDAGATAKLERDALAIDPTYIAADKKVADATAAYNALRTKFKDSMKNDASLATLRQARDDAQTKLTAAQAKLDTDRKGGTASAGG